MMSYLNRLNFSLPYFASKENQTLYVVIPAVKPMVLKQSHKEIGNFSPEEEILPDFRCKICSVRISTYSEFKVHQQDHEKAEEDRLRKSYFLQDDKIQLLRNSSYGMKLNLSENFKNNPMFDPSEYNSNFKTIKNKNGVHNKIFPSEIVSCILPKEYGRHLSSSKTIPSSNNSICNSNNCKMSDCSKFEEFSEIQSGMLETELRKPNWSKLPFIRTLNKCGINSVTSKFSNLIDANLSHIKDNFDCKSILSNVNAPVSNQIHTSTISREIIQGRENKIPAVKSSTSNVTLTVTHTGLKQLLTPRKRKKVVEVIKPYSVTSHQSQLTNLSRDNKNSENEIIQDRVFGIRANQTMNQLNDSFSPFHSPSDSSNYSAVSYFENDIIMEDNIRSKTLECDKNKSSSIISLQSMDVKDHSLLILHPLSNTKERGNQIVDKFDDSISTSQPFSNISSSALTTCSEYGIHAEKTSIDEAVKCEDNSPLKSSTLQSTETNDRGVYILETSTNAKVKPMRCFYCRKTFKSCVQMRKHLLLHEESKTLFCAMCNLCFTRISTFRSHLLIFHCQAKDGKKCPYCEYRYFRTSSLENHLVRIHLKYKCTFCMRKFINPKELNIHLAKRHLNTKTQ